MPVAVTLPEPWSRSRLSVVVPTYNEAENLPVLVEQVLALPLPELRLVVVDDNSPDGTGELADKLAAAHPGRITVVHRTAKDGLGRAYVAGMTRALADGAEFVAQMDADLSHPPFYLPQLLGTMLSTNAGVVIGSRYVAGGSLSGWDCAAACSAPGQRLRQGDPGDAAPRHHVGFKVWRRSALEAIDLPSIHSSGFIQVEMRYAPTAAARRSWRSHPLRGPREKATANGPGGPGRSALRPSSCSATAGPPRHRT